MENKKINILFVDDEESFVHSMMRGVSIRTTNYNLHSAFTEQDALRLTKEIQPEVIVVDLCIHGGGPESGLSLIPKFFEINEDVRIIVLTGMSDDTWGIRCLNAGAASFLVKPVDSDRLVGLLHDTVNVSRLMRASKQNDGEARQIFESLGVSTKSNAMAEVLDQIVFATISSQPVLLCGETGVGKSFIAQTIHKAGVRAKAPFVRSQPTYGSHDLAMSEFFGHTKGAYTGATEGRRGLIEQANGGTLFIDEIDQFSHEVQVALLHVLQAKEYNVVGGNQRKVSDFRLISATNCPFEQLEKDNRLRRDFYHRIAHTVIHIPPLRERRADIPDIARSILARCVTEEQGNVRNFSKEALIWLTGQPWRGNIRELESVVEGGYLQAKFFNRTFVRLSDLLRRRPCKVECIEGTLSEQLRIYEMTIATNEFSKHSHNQSATARALGIDRKRLRKILSRAEVQQ